MFHFKNFSLSHHRSTLKIGTDSVLLASVTPVDNAATILDIGCGCGVIAFCLADKMKPQQQLQYILGIDIDRNSIDEAMDNLNTFPQSTKQKIEFRKESLQQLADNALTRFDLIVSNPPFFSYSLKPNSSQLCKSKHRDQNLSFQELVESVHRLLKANGHFYLILPTEEFHEFKKICNKKLYLHTQWNIFPVRGKEPNRFISCFTLEKNEKHYEYDLFIRDEQHQYTKEYRTLTDRFYLSLK